MAKGKKRVVASDAKSSAMQLPGVGDVPQYDFTRLDGRRQRGFRLFELIEKNDVNAAMTTIDPSSTVYVSASEGHQPYIVRRELRNIRGTHETRYTCSCPDFTKEGRSDCKHVFCDRLRRAEVVVLDDEPKREVNRVARRRPVVDKKIAAVGLPDSSVRRKARVNMPVRVPELLAMMKAAADRDAEVLLPRSGGQLTPAETRAMALIVKTSEGKSADAMVHGYKPYITSGLLDLRAAPHQNTLSQWMNDANLTDTLTRMFEMTTLPFRRVETAVLMDASKFSQSSTTTSRGVDYQGDDRPFARWLKCNALTGLETNVVLAMEFMHSDRHEINSFQSLMEKGLKYFDIVDLLADKGYLSAEVVGWSKLQGIRAIIPVKKAVNFKSAGIYYEACRELIEWYDEHRDLFDNDYRFRCKIESVFSVMKRMFDGYCWSHGRPREQTDDGVIVAWKNETICKMIAYNLRMTVLHEERTGYRANYLVNDRFFPPIPLDQRLLSRHAA